MERVIKDGKMFRSLLILFSILISVLFLCSSEGLTDEAFIGYGGGGYNGKLMIFSIPGLELLKDVPIGVDIRSPVTDRKNLFVVDKAQDTLYMIDLSNLSVKKSIKLPDYFGPNSIAISKDGKSIYIAGELSGKVASVDVDSGKAITLDIKPLPSSPIFVALATDGKYCLVSDYSNNRILRISTSPFKLDKELKLRRPHEITVTPDGKSALVSSKFSASITFVDLKDFKVENVLKTGAFPLDVIIDSKGTFAYQSQHASSEIVKIDIAKKGVVGRFSVKYNPSSISITPDDKYLVSVNKFSTGIYDGLYSNISETGGTVTPQNMEVIELASGKSIKQAAVSGDISGIIIPSREAIKDASLKGKNEFIKKGSKPDVAPKEEGVKISYMPADDRPPGISDADDGAIEIRLRALSYIFAPNIVNCFKGDTVRFIITNIDEKALYIDKPDVVHGFTINGFGKQTNVL
ncbi:MAG: beta-propeller fold lactonase family protein, partial [Nitrospinota bacterium]